MQNTTCKNYKIITNFAIDVVLSKQVYFGNDLIRNLKKEF